MNFDFSDEQLALKDEARRFLTSLAPVEATRKRLGNGAPSLEHAIWDAVVAQGWPGAVIPEEYGGLELSYLELCVLAEELGYNLVTTPFGSSIYLFAELIMLAGSDEQKQTLLPEIAAGRAIGTLAVTERPGGLGLSSPATRHEDGRLTGEKLPIFDATSATHAIVLADSEDGPSLFIAATADEGVVLQPVETIDPACDGARLLLRNTPAERLGQPGAGRLLLEAALDRAAALYAFEQVGLADRCLDMAVGYVQDRYAFGRKIGSYQAIKHKLADIYVKNQLARSCAYYAAWALNERAPQLRAAAAAARIAASDALWHASNENIQVHGGIGYTWESDCHLFFRRAKHLALLIGAPGHWKQRLTSELERSNPQGEC